MRRRGAGRNRRASGNAVLRVLGAGDPGKLSRVRRFLRRPAAHGLLRGEGEQQLWRCCDCWRTQGAGFDIVSGGELYRVLKAGGDPAKVVFSGVGKTAAEIDAGAGGGNFCFQLRIRAGTRADRCAGASARREGARRDAGESGRGRGDARATFPPGRLAHKFGIDIGEAEAVYERARELQNLLLEGVSCHIGSQLMDPAPVMEAVDRVLALIERLRAQGFRYSPRRIWAAAWASPISRTTSRRRLRDFVAALRKRVAGRGLHVMIEPGRSIVAERRGSADARAVSQEDRRERVRDRRCAR